MAEEEILPDCAQCGAELQLDGTYPVIEWDNGDPDDIFCNKDCTFDWMAANGATWKNPSPQPDVA